MRAGAMLAAVLAAAVLAAPAAAADQKKIDAAIKRGADYLRGSFEPGKKNTGQLYGAGLLSLAGLAMLEAGVPANDPSVQYVTEYIRATALRQTDTYHVSLCLLYLDRLGDPADLPVVQMLGVRLYAGMNAAGGWGYHCWEEVSPAELSRLQQALQKSESLGKASPKKGEQKDPKDDGFLKPGEGAEKAGGGVKLHSEVARTLAVVQQAIRTNGRAGLRGGSDDNSNTQFALIALWVAARNGVPAKDAFTLIEGRFLRTQSAKDGGWSYGDGTGSTVAMTCAGLLGLAVGGASRDGKQVGAAPDKGDKKNEDDPFFNPTKSDGERADPAVKPRAGNTVRDKSAEAGLRVLGAFLAAQQGGRPALGGYVGIGNILYMLWSLERVGVAYSLDTIGGIDWYDWGSDVVLSLQESTGAFKDVMYNEDVNTSFAILFLAKANFTKDLSARNKGKDPGKVELRGSTGGKGADAPLAAPSRTDPRAANRGGGAASTDGNPIKEDPAKGGFSLPKVEQPTEQGEAEKVAKGLTGATSQDEWTGRLAEARDTKGAKWTRGLVLAASRLDGEKRREARDALADRLTRMTAKTLREMLKNEESELRRAACLAAGMKEDKGYMPDLIERLTDPTDVVARAARAALMSLSGTDFGPKGNADQDTKLRAAADWTRWYDANGAKR